MTNNDLPPLPEPYYVVNKGLHDEQWHWDAYSADQMRAYAQAAIEAELERWVLEPPNQLPTDWKETARCYALNADYWRERAERAELQTKQADERGDEAMRRAHAEEERAERAEQDARRLDWLESQGSGISVVHDDHQHWAVSDGGFQPVPNQDGTPFSEVVDMTSTIEPTAWRKSIREAIDAAIAQEQPK